MLQKILLSPQPHSDAQQKFRIHLVDMHSGGTQMTRNRPNTAVKYVNFKHRSELAQLHSPMFPDEICSELQQKQPISQ